MSRFEQRRDRLRRAMRRRHLESLLVTNFTNVTYLTGFTGDDSYLLIAPGAQILFSDSRYALQLQEECPDLAVEIRPAGKPLLSIVASGVSSAGLTRLGIEGPSLTVLARDELARLLPKVELVVTDGHVEELRAVKDGEEVELIRRAGAVAGRAYTAVRAMLRVGMTEREVAYELEHIARYFGAEGCSFPPIVAVGDRSALPHYRPGRRPLEKNSHMLVDWGASVSQYKSDLTRVIVAGRIPPKLKKVYEVVFAAQRAAIAQIRDGVACRAVDAAAREVIVREGWGDCFGHGVGHGIGLEIHEAPRLGPSATGRLKSGMVITVEPGIYLPGLGGVRIEDDVLVTSDGCQVLTDVPKSWTECQLDLP